MSRAQSTVTLKKWGNSIGLVLSAALAKEARLFSGTKVEISLGDEALVVRKAGASAHRGIVCGHHSGNPASGIRLGCTARRRSSASVDA